VIFDTDVFIWIQRGNRRAAQLVRNAPSRFPPIQTYMELPQVKSQDFAFQGMERHRGKPRCLWLILLRQGCGGRLPCQAIT